MLTCLFVFFRVCKHCCRCLALTSLTACKHADRKRMTRNLNLRYPCSRSALLERHGQPNRSQGRFLLWLACRRMELRVAKNELQNTWRGESGCQSGQRGRSTLPPLHEIFFGAKFLKLVHRRVSKLYTEHLVASTFFSVLSVFL